MSYLVVNNPLECSYSIKGHAALDRNPVPGYNTLLLGLIPGDCSVPIDYSTLYLAFYTVKFLP